MHEDDLPLEATTDRGYTKGLLRVHSRLRGVFELDKQQVGDIELQEMPKQQV